MQEWIDQIFGDALPPAATYIILFVAFVLGILILIWIARRLLGGTFISGGKTRHLRLAIMDATPVDSRRRLVLVRRDDVEHLILIGGPTDVVVEQNIRHSAPQPARQEAQRQDLLRQEPPRQEPPRQEEPKQDAVYDYNPNQEPARMEEVVRPVLARVAAPAPVAPPTPLAPPVPAPQPVRTFAPPLIAARPIPPAPAVRPATPAQPAPRYEPRPAAPVVERPTPPVRIEPAPMPAPVATVAPVVASPIIAAPIVAAPIVAAVATVAAAPKQVEAELVKTDFEDDAFLDLSNEIDFAMNGDAPEISLEDEMESLLATLDTKDERKI